VDEFIMNGFDPDDPPAWVPVFWAARRLEGWNGDPLHHHPEEAKIRKSHYREKERG
jgi:hypothetical protein